LDWGKLARKELKPPFIPKLSNPKDLKYFDKVIEVILKLIVRCSPMRTSMRPLTPGMVP